MARVITGMVCIGKQSGYWGISKKTLREFKSIAKRFTLSVRTDKLSWRHHYEVASIKKIDEYWDLARVEKEEAGGEGVQVVRAG
jgi:hypothetical protein